MDRATRFLVHGVFFYTCIEGFIINLFYPSKVAFVIKDVLILALYAAVLLPNFGSIVRRSPAVRSLTLPALFFSFAVVSYILLPGSSLLGGLIAIKQRLFYIPLVAVAYVFIRSEKDAGRLARSLAVYAIGVSLFGIYLYFTGPEGLRRLGANYAAEFSTAAYLRPEETYWRVPGTFNSPGQYGAFLLFNSLVAVALLMSRSLPKRWKVTVIVSLVLMMLALFTSGSRAPLVILMAALSLVLFLTGKVDRVAVWAMTGYLIFLLGSTLLGAGVEDRFQSIFMRENVERFRDTYFGQMFLPRLAEAPLGRGLGVATIGARHVLSDDAVELVESYLGILAIENGILGLLTFVWLCASVCVVLLRLRKYMRASPTRVLWHAFLAYVLLIILQCPLGTGIDHAPINLYFWFSIGVLIKQAELWRHAELASQLNVRARLGALPVPASC